MKEWGKHIMTICTDGQNDEADGKIDTREGADGDLSGAPSKRDSSTKATRVRDYTT